jgi:hypothetical protein
MPVLRGGIVICSDKGREGNRTPRYDTDIIVVALCQVTTFAQPDLP